MLPISPKSRVNESTAFMYQLQVLRTVTCVPVPLRLLHELEYHLPF